MTEYADPPGMPEDERMTDAEFRVVREYLGLTGEWLAGHLGVSSRTVRHWEQGRYPIPDGVRLAIEQLEADTAGFVSGIVASLNSHPDPDVTVMTYRNDEEYRAAHPDVAFPASWHRALIARVAQEVPGLGVAYQPQASGAAEGAPG